MDIDDGDATEGDALPKASTKKKPPKVEENRSKKEHVNVVFIGHVGEFGKKCAVSLATLTQPFCLPFRCWQIHNRRTNHVIDGNG
jgi:hypothetical protein